MKRVKEFNRRDVLGLAGSTAAAAWLVSGASTFAADRFAEIPKAMWVWKNRIESPGGLGEFVSAWGIGTLLLYCSPRTADAILSSDPEPLETLRAFRRMGTRIYVCAGEPDWCRPFRRLPEHAALLARLRRELPELIAGVHFDVEPNALPEWRQTGPSRLAVSSGMLRFYEAVLQQVPKADLDAAANPAFAEEWADSGKLLEGLARRVGTVSLMAYRNRVEAVAEWAAPAVSVLRENGTRWHLGVDVESESFEPHITWFGHSRDEFIAAMLRLNARVRQRGYIGLCFQSYDGLKAILST